MNCGLTTWEFNIHSSNEKKKKIKLMIYLFFRLSTFSFVIGFKTKKIFIYRKNSI